MINESRQRWACIIIDFVMSSIAVLLFNVVRFYAFAFVESDSLPDFLMMRAVVLGQFSIPLVMIGIYYLSGYYVNVFQRSRLDELLNTALSAFVGAMMIYFSVLVNDRIDDRGEIYEMVGMLFVVLFVCVYLGRIIMTVRTRRHIRSGRIVFNTLIVGTSRSAISLASRISSSSNRAGGMKIVGFVNVGNGPVENELGLPVYGMNELDSVIRSLQIKNLIVIPHRNGMGTTVSLIASLFPTGLSILISPTLFHIITGRTNFSDVAGEPLTDISRSGISPMTSSVKRAADFVISVAAIVLLSPVMAAIAVAIKMDSAGPVIFRQERIGYHKRPFKILKFRSMRCDAEEDGPALSAADDPRVTKIGRFLRKYRLDELPQFWNVIKGEMSIVGPRPEREYYIRQIVEKAPYYTLIHQVRPGITSWGMVKYGYAASVDQMIERLKYDLLYLENVSVGVDLKIIFHTFSTVFTGKGV